LAEVVFRITEFGSPSSAPPPELRSIWQLRSHVLVEELHRITHQHVADDFDRVATHITAYRQGSLAGSLRLVSDSDLHLLGRRRFSGESRVELGRYREGRNRVVEVSRLVVSPQSRNGFTTVGMLACVYLYAKKNSFSHAFIIASCEIAAAQPTQVPALYTDIGFRPIGPIRRRYYDGFDCDSVPMVLAFDEIGEGYRRLYDRLMSRMPVEWEEE